MRLNFRVFLSITSLLLGLGADLQPLVERQEGVRLEGAILTDPGGSGGQVMYESESDSMSMSNNNVRSTVIRQTWGKRICIRSAPLMPQAIQLVIANFSMSQLQCSAATLLFPEIGTPSAHHPNLNTTH